MAATRSNVSWAPSIILQVHGNRNGHNTKTLFRSKCYMVTENLHIIHYRTSAPPRSAQRRNAYVSLRPATPVVDGHRSGNSTLPHPPALLAGPTCNRNVLASNRDHRRSPPIPANPPTTIAKRTDLRGIGLLAQGMSNLSVGRLPPQVNASTTLSLMSAPCWVVFHEV